MSADATLRPCPFCADEHPIVVRSADVAGLEFVTCRECGAVGPVAKAQDPPGHSIHLWNLRFGAGAEH